MAFVNDLYFFDLFSLRWLEIQGQGTPPQRRYKHSSLVVNDCLYIVGGGNTNSSFNDIHGYLFMTNQWISIKLDFYNYPIDLADPPLNQIVYYNSNNTIVILGGYDTKNKNNSIYLFNINSKTTIKKRVNNEYSFLDSFQFFTY